MIADFNAGHDIHAATAARIFHKSIEEVTRDERRKAKTANFGIIYGISAFGLSERLGIPRGEAKELIDSYFDTYPKVKEYNVRLHRARTRTRLHSHRVQAPPLPCGHQFAQCHGARLRRAQRRERPHTRYRRRHHQGGDGGHRSPTTRGTFRHKKILQVHDELNFSVPHRELDTVRRLVVEEMERAYSMRVPLLAECGSGTNWLEAH